MRFIVAFVSVIFAAQSCQAWSEGGHYLIAILAYDLLTPADQAAVNSLIKSHPKAREHFTVPQNESNAEHWLIGTAAFWPDLARKSAHDRPKWHYIQQASLVVGTVQIHKPMLAIPLNADLNTRDLNIVQALKMCHKILMDKSAKKDERAIALCWVCHLVGDAHQPCHAGSLFTDKILRDGDRGGNEIPTKQRRNLHALWDSLLGPKYDAGDIRRRSIEIKSDPLVWNTAESSAVDDPEAWICENAEISVAAVYAPEVLDQIIAANNAGVEIEKINLSETYLRSSGNLARRRAALAAQRLARSLTGISKQ